MVFYIKDLFVLPHFFYFFFLYIKASIKLCCSVLS